MQLKVDKESNIKIMSHVTSIGLNVIVAPMSFCVLVCFFLQPLFTWGLSDHTMEDLNNKKVDVKRVVIAVIIGIIMIFIEIILFVIRLHKKKKLFERIKILILRIVRFNL